VEAETEVHGPDDHLVMYYTDYLDAPPAPPITKISDTEMDVMELKKWLSTVKPRSRTDAFPLYQLAKGVLNGLADSFLQLTEKERDKKLNKPRYVSFLIFHSGCCILSGISTMFVKDIYDNFINIVKNGREHIEEKLDV
jgi:hypothetical protein